MNRRSFLKYSALTAGSVGAMGSVVCAGVKLNNDTLNLKVGAKRPNILYIMLDDAGIGDFKSYNPVTPIMAPNVIKLASKGMRFTNAYTPGVVCGPTRSALMTGYHLGHASMRGNFNSACIHPDDVTIPEIMKSAGYTTGGWGKWGIGSPGTPTAPELKGFDEFFGYYHQVHAHDHYPDRLYLNGQAYMIPENTGAPNPSTAIIDDKYTHQQNLVFGRMKQFVKTNAIEGKPFFAYGTWTLPHVDSTIPKAETLPGGSYAPYANEPWSESAKIQAAMMTWIDRQVGELIAVLDDPHEDGSNKDSIADNTLVVFCSDNGGYEVPLNGAWDRNYQLKGAKGSLNEGGIRTPLIFVWPGKIKPGTKSDMLTSLVDMMATFADLAGVSGAVPSDSDSISLVPAILGKGIQVLHEGFYVQKHNINPIGGKSDCARVDDGIHKWKAIRSSGNAVTSLYDLATDIGENNNVLASNPGVAGMMKDYMDRQHTVMMPQYSASPPSVGNCGKDGIVSYGIRPAPAARNWNVSQSGDAQLLSGQIKDGSTVVKLYLDDLYKTFKVEMSVTVNGSSKPNLQLSIANSSSSYEYFKATMATASVASGTTQTLEVMLGYPSVTPGGSSGMGGDLNEALTLYISHAGSLGDVSVNNIKLVAI